jgi:hypothetical protein
MPNQRFHTGLITLLAIGFGAALTVALSPQSAVGYPAGAAISYGANPVWSKGGVMNGDSNQDILTAPADQSVVITDIALSLSSTNSGCATVVEAGLGDGTATSLDSADLGRFTVGVNREGYSYTRYHPFQTVQLRSGATIEGGDTLQIYSDVKWAAYCSESEVRLSYMISGYYASP